MRKCLLTWGVPDTVKTDNGSDFVAHATTQLLAGLGIEVALSPPYQPRTKGVVERVIGTFQRDLARLPGFIGHSVADRKKRRLSAGEDAAADDLMWLGSYRDTAEYRARARMVADFGDAFMGRGA